VPAIDVPERVVRRIERRQVAGPNGCVISTYSVGSHGYAQVGWNVDGSTRMHLVHRLVYQLVCGPIPDGMTIDHICRNRRCVNWLHLRLLSNKVNGTLNGNALKTHCPQGHPYDEANTNLRRHRSGRLHRFCRACAQATRDARPRNPRTTPTAAEAILSTLSEVARPLTAGELAEQLPQFRPTTVRQIADRLVTAGRLQRPAAATYEGV
jgi:hypothetical protein